MPEIPEEKSESIPVLIAPQKFFADNIHPQKHSKESK